MKENVKLKSLIKRLKGKLLQGFGIKENSYIKVDNGLRK